MSSTSLAYNVPCAAAVAEKNFVTVNIPETYCENEYTTLLVNSNSNCAVLADVSHAGNVNARIVLQTYCITPPSMFAVKDVKLRKYLLSIIKN